eukprot:TRINITY_DN30905_c0_g1_i1.p2 TRINITY_DN30905_c0_g1~~TRINITY_DN30905_c0_g1_i1.p2  ORF type:complete len:120 (+),score=19.15 TRINITY_DN30905_c0_g1_i1:230-589(+)
MLVNTALEPPEELEEFALAEPPTTPSHPGTHPEVVPTQLLLQPHAEAAPQEPTAEAAETLEASVCAYKTPALMRMPLQLTRNAPLVVICLELDPMLHAATTTHGLVDQQLVEFAHQAHT